MPHGQFSFFGEKSAEQFLAEYWQRQPLLIRDGLPGFKSPLTADELAGLSLEDDIESRIVVENGKSAKWELINGPFTEATFGQLPPENWTLLVQAVDIWVPEVRQILDHFRFLPPWRLDDIMVSYAPKGGSVGPHFDYYDVFLIQGEGQRRWQIGGTGEKLCNEASPFEADTSLRILRDFQFDQTFILNPGDILYLPPQVAHHGVAVDDCITYSVGFRAPTAAEMLGDLATELMTLPHTPHYQDPKLTLGTAGNTITPAHVSQVRSLLSTVLEDDDVLADWFARYMTTPKYPDLVDETGETREAKLNSTVYRNGEPCKNA